MTFHPASFLLGMTAMVELRSWLANLDLPNPADLLDGKATFDHNRDRCAGSRGRRARG